MPHALIVFWNSMQGRRQFMQAEERVPGNKMLIIAKHGDQESRISDDSLSGIRHLTEMVHGRARAPSRQTLRVAANEVRSRVAPRGWD